MTLSIAEFLPLPSMNEAAEPSHATEETYFKDTAAEWHSTSNVT